MNANNINIKKLLEFSELTPRVKEHLNQVYGTLSIGCLCAGATCLYTPAFIVNNLLFLIFSIIATIVLVVTMFSKKGNQDHGTKFVCFLAITAIDGACLRPLMDRAIEVDPVIIVNALLYTGVIFGSFTLASLLTKRRSMLFLGGILSSIMIGLTLGLLISFITGSGFISYLGYNIITLVVFSFYVMYDTQLIVEKASVGDFDYNIHALELFVDLIQIFIRIVRILISLSEKKKDD